MTPHEFIYFLSQTKPDAKIYFTIPKLCITNISHQLFYFKITFMNSEPYKANSNGDNVHKNHLTFVLKISVIQN